MKFDHEKEIALIQKMLNVPTLTNMTLLSLDHLLHSIYQNGHDAGILYADEHGSRLAAEEVRERQTAIKIVQSGGIALYGRWKPML